LAAADRVPGSGLAAPADPVPAREASVRGGRAAGWDQAKAAVVPRVAAGATAVLVWSTCPFTSRSSTEQTPVVGAVRWARPHCRRSLVYSVARRVTVVR
jgi:hypothetical protein